MPKMFCNLFSITTAISAGCTITGGNNEPLTMSKGGKSFKFDRSVGTGKSKLIGIKIVPWVIKFQNYELNVNMAHNFLGHCSEATTIAPAKRLE